MNFDAIIKEVQSDIILKIATLAREENTEVYLVGGFVRDLLLGRQSKDVDMLVIGDGIAFAKKAKTAFGPEAKLAVFKNFMTANLQVGDLEIEFVGARKESYRRSSRNPIVEEGTLKDDLLRRDFTINALAVSLNSNNYGEVIDMFNGIDDLKNRIIRTPLEPVKTFSDDPLRMLRAARFASQLQFRIEENTFAALGENVERMDIITRERITEEINKILLSDQPSIGFKILHSSNLLDKVFPELEALYGVDSISNVSHKDNFFHTLQVVDNVSAESDNLWLRWAALLHDIGKPATKRFYPSQGWTFHGHEVVGERMTEDLFRRFKLPQNEKMKYVQKLVRLHLRPIALTKEEVSDSAVRRLIYDAGDDVEDLLVLCKADITSKNQAKVERYLANLVKVGEKIREVEEKDRVRNWKSPVSGDEIMKIFNIRPSRTIGILKEKIKEAVLNGEIKNNREAILDYVIREGEKLGLEPVPAYRN